MNSQPKPNPINPPTTGHAVLVFATLVLCAAFAEVATGLVAPAMPVMGHLFAKSPATMQLTIVSFAVPFALGQLFFGPFSDAKGRRPALLLGAVFTVVGSIVAGSADTIWMVFLARVVQGLGAAAGYVVARAMIRDIYGPQGAAKAMALLFALMSASFMVAPLIGGSLLDVAGWRAGFIFAAAIAAVWLASTVLIMPETRGIAAQSRPEAVSTIYLRLFRHRGFLGFMLTHATGYAGLYCFVAGAPYYFIDSRDMTATGFGLVAALAMSGFLIGSTAARFVIPRFGMGRVIYASLAVMVLGPAALVVLGLLTHLPLELIILMQFAVWFGGGFLAPNTAAGVMMSHPQAAGAAAAVLGFVQMCAAGTVALLQGVIYDGTVFPIAGMQLLLAVLAFVIWHRLKQYSLPPSAAA